jgi:hypothetical protein
VITHARAPFSRGFRPDRVTLCGALPKGAPVLDAATVENRARVDCPVCVKKLQREDERAPIEPMADGKAT